jgi:hypothetical protein
VRCANSTPCASLPTLLFCSSRPRIAFLFTATHDNLRASRNVSPLAHATPRTSATSVSLIAAMVSKNMLEGVAALEGCHRRLATQMLMWIPEKKAANALAPQVTTSHRLNMRLTTPPRYRHFSALELLFFLDETHSVSWRTLTLLTVLGKIRPSPRALLSPRQPSRLLWNWTPSAMAQV